MNKIETDKIPLEYICEFSLGLTPYDKYKGHTETQIKNRVFHSTTKKDTTFKKLLSGEDIKRYYVAWGGKEYISYGNWLGAARRKEFFNGEKIFVRQIVSGNPLRIYSCYSDEEYYITQIGFSIINKEGINLKYILSILNSNLMNYYHRNKYLDQSKNIFQKILIQNAKQFPFPEINLNNSTDKEYYDSLVLLVEQMLSTQKDYRSAKSESDNKIYEQKISMLDKKIDKVVYELYGLNQEEIRIVEGNNEN